jgi:hypothetical protein
MLCLAAAAAVLAPLAAASEAPDFVTIAPTFSNATSTAWVEAGSKVQIALALADAQLLPLAGGMLNTNVQFCLMP